MTATKNTIQRAKIDFEEVNRCIAAGRMERSKFFNEALLKTGAAFAKLFDLHAMMQKNVSFEPTVKAAPKH